MLWLLMLDSKHFFIGLARFSGPHWDHVFTLGSVLGDLPLLHYPRADLLHSGQQHGGVGIVRVGGAMHVASKVVEQLPTLVTINNDDLSYVLKRAPECVWVQVRSRHL